MLCGDWLVGAIVVGGNCAQLVVGQGLASENPDIIRRLIQQPCPGRVKPMIMISVGPRSAILGPDRCRALVAKARQTYAMIDCVKRRSLTVAFCDLQILLTTFQTSLPSLVLTGQAPSSEPCSISM